MKTVKTILIAAAAVLIGSCSQPYEENWDLAVDYETINATYDKETVPVTVYCSDKWTAAITEGSDWAGLDKTSGKGVTTVHVLCGINRGLSRQATLQFKSGKLSKEIQIIQAAGIKDAAIVFETESLEYPSVSCAGATKLLSNLPEDYIASLEPQIRYEGSQEGWISDVTISKESSLLPEEAGVPGGRSRDFGFHLASNSSGESRQAYIVVSIAETFKDSILVVQSGETAYLHVPEQDLVSKDGGERKLDIESNLGTELSKISLTVRYITGEGFISGEAISAGKLVYAVAPNTTTSRRQAAVDLVYTALDGTELSASVSVEQNVEVQQREISFEDIRTTYADGGTYAGDEAHEDYLLGLIIGEGGNPNMDQNINYGTTVDGLAANRDKSNANNIYTTENDRTNYVESIDGSFGFRIKYAEAEDNVLKRGDKVKIYLGGVRIIKESDPLRYTIANLDRVVVEETGVALPVKNKTVAALTDADIYTWCTLQDMEFQIKRGGYTNVREYDAIINPVNEELPVATNQARRAKDGAANLLYDKDNSGIYMLVNMNCPWRWDSASKKKKAVPQGKGNLSGIIVHQEMERWGGNVGRYSIRPFDEDDIDIAQASASSWTNLVEWTFTKKTWSVGSYSWNGNTAATGGYYSTKTTDHYYQEFLNATEAAGMTNNTGDVAQLYLENLDFPQGKTSESYPVVPAWGYRGLDVSNPTISTISNNVDQPFGMSAGSVIEFLCNYSGFYVWDASGNWTGETKGIVAEFSTAGVSGSEAALSFSIAGGQLNRANANNISWTFSSSFPIDWAVEYAVSENGTDFGSWHRVVNAATGKDSFELRSVPFCVSETNATVLDSFHSAAVGKPCYTNCDWGFGLVPYRFVLPAEVLGKARVKLRLVPASTRMAEWNYGASDWNKGQTFQGHRITQTFEFTGTQGGALCLEDILVQYK